MARQVCAGCSGVGQAACAAHGTDTVDFKRRFCCSVALWFCFGTTHFCDPCHSVRSHTHTSFKAGSLLGG
jgi:hypothetical protein